MESNDRMSEIARDLKKDVKELLFESAAVVTGFFKRGLCTVRAAADKWKTFARNVSTAADELMKPPLIQEMEVPATDLPPTDEPVVTVVESGEHTRPSKSSGASPQITMSPGAAHAKTGPPAPAVKMFSALVSISPNSMIALLLILDLPPFF